ncbi:MAG TPA: hypothetical protein VE991_12920 [Acidimicrobiales bacterium]|nr:hypothetical protein [Acidimicrobiales bacterium]
MAWAEVLDEIERQLEAHDRALAVGGGAEAPAYAVPNGLGDLPPALATRAEQLLARTNELADRVMDEQQAIIRAVTAEPSVPRRGPAVYLDLRA